jgi:hypothetical protein
MVALTAVAAVILAALFSTSSFHSSLTTGGTVVSGPSAAAAARPSRTSPTTTAPPPAPPTVCAMLYVWYGFDATTGTWTGGLGSSHWNDGPADVVEDKPVAGYYSSMAVIPSQLQQMWNAGINCVVVDWWGYGITDYSSPTTINPEDAAINNAVKEVFADARSVSPRLKVVLLVDAFDSTMTPSDYQQVYSYVDRTFYSRYSSELVAWDGSPLLLWFNPMVPPSESGFTSRVIGNNDGLISPGWLFWTAPPADFNAWGGTTTTPCTCYYGPRPPSPDGFISVIPRYDDYYLYLSGARTGYMRVDDTYSEGLYQTEWNDVLSQSATKNRPAMVFIYSWNEYHERSTIEPHTDYTDPGAGPNYLLNLTKTNIAALLNS